MNNDFEEFFYNVDGTYKGIGSRHGTDNEHIIRCRDEFMKAEREYFLELLKDEGVRDYFQKLLEEDDEAKFYEATRIQEKIENGELETREELRLMETMTPEERDNYHMRKLELAEGLLCLLFAAIRSKALVKDLVKTYDYDDEKGMSMGR